MSELKNKRINLSMSEKLYDEIVEESQKQNLSMSSYCIQAIEKSLGKVQRIDPKLITVEPVDVYIDDVRQGLSTIGNTAVRLDRLVFTLSQKSNVPEYELKRLVELIEEFKEEERQFNAHMLKVYEDRVQIKKELTKRIEKIVKKILTGGK